MQSASWLQTDGSIFQWTSEQGSIVSPELTIVIFQRLPLKKQRLT